MQFQLFPPTSLKYAEVMCVASEICWTEDVTSTDQCRHPRSCACHYKDIFVKLGVLISGAEKLQSSRMRCHVDLYAGTDIYKKPVDSIFRVVQEE
jgi:hypothetical protein